MYFAFKKFETFYRNNIPNLIESCLADRAEQDRLLVYLDGAYQNPKTYTHETEEGIFYLKSAIGNYFTEGATIVINDIHDKLGRVREELDEIGPDLKANCYISPLSAAGITLHEDPYDVLVLQLHGSKKWLIAADNKLAPSAEPLVVAGDLLFLERGTFHHPSTVSEVSMHLTIRGQDLQQRFAVLRRRPGHDSTEVIETCEPLYFESLIRFREGDPLRMKVVGEESTSEKQHLTNLVRQCNGSQLQFRSLLEQHGFKTLIRDLVYADMIRVW